MEQNGMGWEHLGTFSAPTSYNINIAANIIDIVKTGFI